MTTTRTLFAMLASAIALVPSQGRAGNVTIDDMDLDEGNVTALLEQTSQYYVDAMARLMSRRYRGEYRAIRWEDLEAAMTRNKVARVEYHYLAGGEERVRVYHAMGGEPLGILGKRIFEGPTRPATPEPPDGTPDETVDAATAPTAAERAAADADDDAFFEGFDGVDVRARVLPMNGSVLEPFEAEGWQGGLDPELKALRHIEHDIVSGALPRGGRIDAKVGDILCSSCTRAMHGMADAYGVDIRATQIFQSVPSSTQEALVASGKARMAHGRLLDAASGRPLLADEVLAGAREAQVRRSLSPRALGRSFKGMAWQGRSFMLGGPAAAGTEASPRRPRNPDAEEPPPPEC